jgi:hypothetical protein
MSGIVKGVKKVFKKTGALVGAIGSKVVKTAKKIVKSKVFKFVVAAAAIYFGGAALLSMAGGGTASAGIGSAWAGAQGAGSALMAGNFSGAASALGSGFTGGAAAGATGTFAAGQAATAGTIASASAPAATLATTGATTAIQSATPQLAGMTQAGTVGAGSLATPVATAATTAAPSGGLLASLGEAGKAALVTGAINTGGQMIAGHAQQKAAEEEAENRNYFGVDGKGNATALPGFGGLLDPARLDPMANANPVPQLQPVSTLDDLIKRQKQQVGQWG